MNNHPLIGRVIRIVGADLFEPNQTAVIKAVEGGTGQLLLQLTPPLLAGQTLYAHAIAKPRLAGHGPENLLREGVLGCAITCVANDKFDAGNPFDLSWWRGGGAAIGDLVL